MKIYVVNGMEILKLNLSISCYCFWFFIINGNFTLHRYFQNPYSLVIYSYQDVSLAYLLSFPPLSCKMGKNCVIIFILFFITWVCELLLQLISWASVVPPSHTHRMITRPL